jgi:hypothetical protein
MIPELTSQVKSRLLFHDLEHCECCKGLQRCDDEPFTQYLRFGRSERGADKRRPGMMNSHSWNGISFNSLVGGADHEEN